MYAFIYIDIFTCKVLEKMTKLVNKMQIRELVETTTFNEIPVMYEATAIP